MLNPDGTAEGCCKGTWTCENGRDFRLVTDSGEYVGVVNICYDDARKCAPLCFSALNGEGAAVWGIGE